MSTDSQSAEGFSDELQSAHAEKACKQRLSDLPRGGDPSHKSSSVDILTIPPVKPTPYAFKPDAKPRGTRQSFPTALIAKIPSASGNAPSTQLALPMPIGLSRSSSVPRYDIVPDGLRELVRSEVQLALDLEMCRRAEQVKSDTTQLLQDECARLSFSLSDALARNDSCCAALEQRMTDVEARLSCYEQRAAQSMYGNPLPGLGSKSMSLEEPVTVLEALAAAAVAGVDGSLESPESLLDKESKLSYAASQPSTEASVAAVAGFGPTSEDFRALHTQLCNFYLSWKSSFLEEARLRQDGDKSNRQRVDEVAEQLSRLTGALCDSGSHAQPPEMMQAAA